LGGRLLIQDRSTSFIPVIPINYNSCHISDVFCDSKFGESPQFYSEGCHFVFSSNAVGLNPYTTFVASESACLFFMTTARVEMENEVLKWPPAQRISLAERLLESVTDFTTEEIELAWRSEIARRVGEVESGKVSDIPSRNVFAKARKKLNEARQISSSRRK
jgi:putative addiction module component (TIGR02574 family)